MTYSPARAANQRQKRLVEGRCVRCCQPNPRAPKWYCRPCQADFTERRRKAGYGRKWAKLAKLQAFEAYGGAVCACCAVSELPFLTLDHMEGGGTAERRGDYSVGKLKMSSSQVYARLRREGYPPGYQVLCANCNLGKFTNGGICPHQVQEQVHQEVS